jgi:hypothetical protein
MNSCVATVVVLLTLCISQNAIAAQKSTSKLPAFDLSTTSLPPGFVGIDAAVLLKTFVQHAHVPTLFETTSKIKAGIYEKGEFETTEAFEDRRTAAMHAALPPERTYALSSDEANFTYDADRGVMVMQTGVIVKGGRGYFRLRGLRRVYSEYSGVNAFGVNAKVIKLEVEQVHAGAKTSSEFHMGLFRPGLSNFGTYSLDLPADVSVAKRWKGKHIAALFVGKIDGASLENVLSKFETPTLSNPTEFKSVTWGIPVEVQRLVIYLRDTGEIIKSLDFE